MDKLTDNIPDAHAIYGGQSGRYVRRQHLAGDRSAALGWSTNLRGLASTLNARGVKTARGGRWHVSNVKNVIDRRRPFL